MNKIIKASCAFCQADVQENNFAESENFLAVYNVAPILPGHSLVIPKWHISSIMELSEQELCEMTVFARDVVTVLMKVFGDTAFNWTIQEGVEAGQSVPHLHLHLIPRKQNDLPQPGDWYPLLKKSEIEIIDSEARPKLSASEMKIIAAKLRSTAKEVFSE
jgi:bis(5'-adenosyl)-triphosphatase